MLVSVSSVSDSQASRPRGGGRSVASRGGGGGNTTPASARQVTPGGVNIQPQLGSVTAGGQGQIDGALEDAMIEAVVAGQLKTSKKINPIITTVQSWVKNHLFRRVKFVGINKSDMDYSLEKTSLCQLLLTHVKISGPLGVNFWNEYRSLILKEMNKRRNVCQDQCKKVCLSK